MSYHRNIKKGIYYFQALFCWFYPLLGQNGYKYCLNNPNPSLTPMISQMHWIMTHFDHRYTNKAIAASEQYFVGFSVFWEKGV